VLGIRYQSYGLAVNSIKMKILFFLLISILCFSFCPSIEKAENNAGNGFYVFVEDFTDRTNQKYIVESEDSVITIFEIFFNAELELGKVDRPITIYNGEHNFYVARVKIFKKSNGEKGFRNLKYPNVHLKQTDLNKRQKLEPVTL